MKVARFLLNNIIAPLIVGLLLLIVPSTLSKIFVGNWWQFFINIPLTIWIIIALAFIIWIQIIFFRKKIFAFVNENRNLKDKLGDQVEIVYRDNAYWNTTTNVGPYCSRCLESDNKKITMHPIEGTENRWSCPECKNRITSVQHSTLKNIGPSTVQLLDDDDVSRW